MNREIKPILQLYTIVSNTVPIAPKSALIFEAAMMLLTHSLFLSFLLPLTTVPAAMANQAGYCRWIDSGAGHNSPHHANYTYYCDAVAKPFNDSHVVFDCSSLRVATWGFAGPSTLEIGGRNARPAWAMLRDGVQQRPRR